MKATATATALFKDFIAQKYCIYCIDQITNIISLKKDQKVDIFGIIFLQKSVCLTLGAGTVSVKMIIKYQKILRVRRITVLFGSWVRDRRVREKRKRKILESAVL